VENEELVFTTMVVGTQIWSHGDLSLHEYSSTHDVFFCTYNWHMKDPDWMKKFKAIFNKAIKTSDGEVTKGWVVPLKFRPEFIEGLNKKEGLHKPTPVFEPAPAYIPAPPAQMFGAPVKIVGAIKTRVKQVTTSNDFTMALESLSLVISPYVKDTHQERCFEDKLYLSSNSSTLLSAKVESFGAEWDVLLWIETTEGAAAILKKQ
jgi:hypothetical protein